MFTIGGHSIQEQLHIFYILQINQHQRIGESPQPADVQKNQVVYNPKSSNPCITKYRMLHQFRTMRIHGKDH